LTTQINHCSRNIFQFAYSLGWHCFEELRELVIAFLNGIHFARHDCLLLSNSDELIGDFVAYIQD